jgi:16S rRNA (guanine966-N2)-methyltransferase
MRVITGRYKGRTIRTVNDLSVRPATDRVRVTIFNMLEHRINFAGIRVLDLFAGSGSLGIEALSRGAASTTFVEQQHQAALFLEENLRLLGCLAQSGIAEMDALSYCTVERTTYDLVFADPPYAYARTEEVPAVVFGGGLVRPGGYLVMEHAHHLHFAAGAAWDAGPEKKFGRTLVTFFRPKQIGSSAS